MTSEEIEEAMSRANGKAPSATTTATAAAPVATQQPGGAVVPYNTAVATQPPPVPARPSYDWRDVFIAAVLAGGATYGLWTLAKVCDYIREMRTMHFNMDVGIIAFLWSLVQGATEGRIGKGKGCIGFTI